LRLGLLLMEDPRRVEDALRRLQESERITARLMAEDPKNFRYQQNALVLDRRIGEVLAALGRNGDATRRLERAVTAAAGLMRRPEGRTARLQMILASLRLAMLRARAGDSRVAALADSVAAEIARPPTVLTPPWNEATVSADLGRIYRASGRTRDAVIWLEKSRQAWQDMKVPRALEARQKSELARVEAELAASRR
ncbi:MAG: hypothetical protein HY013_17760, partial [Candidatus Solibacter usitatus]|nr:hypothetical protein [Candidatus Solibacter usitatus]